ncbi:unnamed protein product [Meloidogyne enterolobii]|uniref:Uncharacterized protein n=1 Tax=Meloidogyne enterolobii TaxID=390850 RepID=A0ACB0ZP51_MELEN
MSLSQISSIFAPQAKILKNFEGHEARFLSFFTAVGENSRIWKPISHLSYFFSAAGENFENFRRP